MYLNDVTSFGVSIGGNITCDGSIEAVSSKSREKDGCVWVPGCLGAWVARLDWIGLNWFLD